jgi:hypothetical protein
MKTGSWQIPVPAGHIKIGISRGSPRGHAAGFKLYKVLAPGPWFNSVSPAEYYRLYKVDILAPLDPAKIVTAILDRAAGHIPVLCCFERPNGREWCHRAMAAEWLAAHLKEPVPEVGFEHLPQHEHPLMPAELRRHIPTEAAEDVTPFLGKTAVINQETYTVLRPDPANPGQAICAGENGKEFSTSLDTLKRYFLT